MLDPIKNIINKLAEKTSKGKYLYRTSLVRMYYATRPKEKTPTPFLEMRAFVITDKPVPDFWLSRLEKELDWLESFVLTGTSSKKFKDEIQAGLIKFINVPKGIWEAEVGTITSRMKYTIIGSEFNRKIDLDEAIGPAKITPEDRVSAGNFRSTGLPPEEWNLYEIYRYVAFFKRDGGIKRDYNEREIRTYLEPTAVKFYRFWLRQMAQVPEFRESYMKWVLRRRGIPWRKGYTVSKPYIWRGRPVVVVRYKGRFIKGGFLIGRPIPERMLEKLKKELGAIE